MIYHAPYLRQLYYSHRVLINIPKDDSELYLLGHLKEEWASYFNIERGINECVQRQTLTDWIYIMEPHLA